MDKLFTSPWFVKLISFFIALMLFLMVNADNFTNQPSVLPGVSKGSHTLTDVPLVAHFDEDQYVVTEMTESVQVNLTGPQGALIQFQVARPNYEVFVDLQDKGPGVHHVSIHTKGFPRELSVSVVPQFVRVVLQEKKTMTLPVTVDLVNSDEVAEGYTVGTPIVTPVTIEITAAEEIIEQVAIAKAYVDVQGADRTIEKGVPVKVYDQVGNELHLDIEPAIVDVRVPITSPYKEVPVKVSKQGEPPEGLSVESVILEPKEVTIFGPRDVIGQISIIEGLEIDLSTITESQTLQLAVPRPRGVERVDPQVINVTVELNKEETLLIEEVPVDINGLSEGLELIFESPVNQLVNVTLKGTTALLEKVNPENIQAFIDVNELALGEHEIEIQVIGPQNLSFESSSQKATVIIKEQSNE
ncbi:CdaR family protein [Bacillus sp. FJAT-45350]|uniref:CdaR family protein n=1 Tax=Bacillus sp. FJAT-45350 TaxID=2011014 RepID=UPI000BB8447C|nr:CdaR family protein [Bacillus sp. FJAT-45350]